MTIRKSVMILTFLYMLSIVSAAYGPMNSTFPSNGNETSAIKAVLGEIKTLSSSLSSQSGAVKNIHELLSVIHEDGLESWGLLPDLMNEISSLTEKDGSITTLDALMDASDNLSILFKSVSNKPSEQELSEAIRKSRFLPARGNLNFRDDPSTNVEEHFKETPFQKIKGKIHDELLKLDVDTDLKLLSFNLTKDISLGASYKWGLEPSWKEGCFTRIDAYRIKTHFKIGDIIKDLLGSSLPVYLNLKSGQQIIFARHFKKQLKAATALPYNPLKLPINTKNALEMEVGTFVSIPSEMSIVVGASASFGGGLTASANTYYLLSGDFRINILKIDEDRVRVKLIGMRRSGYGAGGSLKYGFNLFGIKILDKQIGNILDTQIFKIDHSAIDGENFSVDYIFNLNNRDGSNAYDKFLNANLKFRVLPTSNPVASSDESANEFFSNLALAENLHIRDRNLAERSRSVSRVFKASNFFEQTATNIKIGFNLIKFIWGRRWIENNLSVYDQDNILSRFFIPVFQAHSENKFLFGLFQSKKTLNTYSLLDTDPAWKVTGINTFAYNLNKYDKKHYAYQYRKTRLSLFNTLGELAVTSGLADKLPESEDAIKKFRLNMKIILAEDTVFQLLQRGAVSKADFWNALYTTMIAYEDELYLWANHDNGDNSDDKYWQVNSNKFDPAKKRVFDLFEKEGWDFDKWRNLEYFERDFARVLAVPEVRERIAAYLKMYKDSYTRTFLMRFSIEASRYAGIPLNYWFSVNARGNGMKTFNMTYGNMNLNDKLYHEINRIISHITDTTYDMFDVVDYEGY